MAKQAQDNTTRINIQELTTHVIESDDVGHKGQPVRLTGKVAMEVELPDGKKAWVRHLDVVIPHEPKRTAAKSAPRTRKAAAKTS